MRRCCCQTCTRQEAEANWQYVREQAANPHRLAQLSTDEQWAAFDSKHQSEMEASGYRRVATVRAVGDAEVAYHWVNHEAKEARIELREYEEECVRLDSYVVEMAESEMKWEQIRQGIDANNACYNPGDPEYWEELNWWEYAQLHSLWKLQ